MLLMWPGSIEEIKTYSVSPLTSSCRVTWTIESTELNSAFWIEHNC